MNIVIGVRLIFELICSFLVFLKIILFWLSRIFLLGSFKCCEATLILIAGSNFLTCFVLCFLLLFVLQAFMLPALYVQFCMRFLLSSRVNLLSCRVKPFLLGIIIFLLIYLTMVYIVMHVVWFCLRNSDVNATESWRKFHVLVTMRPLLW